MTEERDSQEPSTPQPQTPAEPTEQESIAERADSNLSKSTNEVMDVESLGVSDTIAPEPPSTESSQDGDD